MLLSVLSVAWGCCCLYCLRAWEISTDSLQHVCAMNSRAEWVGWRNATCGDSVNLLTLCLEELSIAVSQRQRRFLANAAMLNKSLHPPYNNLAHYTEHQKNRLSDLSPKYTEGNNLIFICVAFSRQYKPLLFSFARGFGKQINIINKSH